MESQMNITGNKVILRAAKKQDQEMLWGLIRDPDIVKVTKGYQSPVSGVHSMAGSFFQPVPSGSFRRIIADQENPETGLGIIMLSDMDVKAGTAQIYIKLLKSARRSGYGQDAVDTLVSYAFHELRLNCICSSILEDNRVSRKLFETCGFRQEGTHESRADQEGHCRRVCSYVRRNE